MNRKKISILGLGYIGLPTALVLSDSGYLVNGFDIDKQTIDQLNRGKLPISENGLDELFKKEIVKNNFIASSSLQAADIYLIAVPTPIYFDNALPKAITKFVEIAALSISKKVKKNDLVIIESTVPVGTTRKISELIYEKTGFSSETIKYAYCPERVLPGNIINELKSNDRVIGGLTKNASRAACNLYSSFCRGKLIETNSECAELVKLSENSYRDINIAFANELSIICEKLGIDIIELISIANHHPRVNILKPGCGVGGHCIAVDPYFIVSAFPEDSLLVQSAREVNNKKNLWVRSKIMEKVKNFELENNRKPIIGCLGLSFKPNIDDLRESPALRIFNYLNECNLDVLACEPNLKKHPSIKLYSLEDIKLKADIIVKLVEHKEFKFQKFQKNQFYDFCK